VFLNRRDPSVSVCERGPATGQNGPTHATTHATTGVTALLQPAQNTKTLHDSIRGTEHARARGIEDGLGVGGLDGGGDVSNVIRVKRAAW
jgi:hypothetical protein